MKKLPIGKQDFESLINGNYVYVDKTEIIYNLISSGSVYFLSRPRRFGKSLLVSTLKEIFSGNKELFKGLWIYDKHTFKKHPIIHIDFSEISKRDIPLKEAIIGALNKIAAENGVAISDKDCGQSFNELIKELSKSEKVVILIDEYDKPIIDYMTQIDTAIAHRDILKNFYSVLKPNDEHIEFLFITGVSKFSKVSIFSDLNHLHDISMHEKYTTLTGYTLEELNTYFKEEIELLKIRFDAGDVMEKIKLWYNGYSWDGIQFVYNPFSMLNFFSQQRFSDFWFETGTPTFLMNLFKNNNYEIPKLENIVVNAEVFNQYTLENLEILPLLFQTGYITVKAYDYEKGKYILGYPNEEVKRAFYRHLLARFDDKTLDTNAIIITSIIDHLNANEIPEFIQRMRSLYKSVSYPLIDNQERYYHTIFYCVIKMMGFDIETEVLTSDGRIDAVIKTEKYIYVIEFKMGKAQEAIEQIQKKQYHLKYANENGKQLILMGIGFDEATKNIEDWMVV